MKSVLLSMQPKWCELIARGVKTVEIRKSKPKIKTPFKCYIYQSKHRDSGGSTYSDGKVIGEFICDEIAWHSIRDDFTRTLYGTCLTEKEVLNYMNFPPVNPSQDLLEARRKYSYYGFFGWHISDLVIYDKPRELSEFMKPCINENISCWNCLRSELDYDKKEVVCCNAVDRPPQSWCYVEKEGGQWLK